MKTIKASVGLRNGTQCYNVVSDQLVVIGLLNSIPAFAGGTQDQPLSASPRWGLCSNALAQAILNFQQMYSLPVDGHVDPGGTTILRMNQAAGEQNVPAAPSGGGGAAAAVVGVDDDYWQCTNMSLTSRQVGEGLSIGVSYGPISFARGNSDRAFKTMQIVQVNASLSGSPLSADDLAKQQAAQAAKSQAVRLIEGIAKNINFSQGDWPGSAAGPCVSFAGLPDNWKAPLEVGDFDGTCFGIDLSAGAAIWGLSGWAIFFGMPGWFGLALLVAALAETPTLGVSNIAIAGLLSQSKGVAFVGSFGNTLNGAAGYGASAGQFLGTLQ